ncbi:MAG TPA: alpha/beta hydrolase [Bryobacteraceae bacterium]|nr:alpha/beta hydrolase [Bryobacteraceae bacterium]
MAGADLKFAHEFVPAGASGTHVTLLLLHGTGGGEHDLVPIGRQLLPGAALLSPRGRVLENGMPRFFRRFAEGVFDIEDLKFRTHELNEFVRAAAERYGTAKNKVVAAGYSNGANIAASLLLLHPHLLAGAILFRAMVPFTPDVAPDLRGVQVFLGPGRRDPIVPRQDTERLPALLESIGAEVEVHWHNGGHELGQDDLAAARHWVERKFAPAQAGGAA